MFSQREKLKHYLGKGNFPLKAKVSRKLIELMTQKPQLADFKIRIDYSATPQGKTLDRSGDIFITVPSMSFEDANLATRVHCAVLIECFPEAQPLGVLTENDAFMQLPYVYTIPVAGKWTKREVRGTREAYSLPWCPIDEDGAERSAGRDYSLPLERGMSALRRELPDPSNMSASIGIMDSSDEASNDRLVGSIEVLVENSLDVIGGLKDLMGRTPMQIDLLMVWPVLITEKTPLVYRESDSQPVPSERIVWWTPVDATGFTATSGVEPPALPFAVGPGIFVTIVGFDDLDRFVDTFDKTFSDIKKRFGRFRLQDLYG